MDWSPEPREAALFAFVAGALRLRAELPLLAAPRWLRGDPVAEGGLPAVRWLRPDGVAMSEAEWTNGKVKAMAVAFAGAGRGGGADPQPTPRPRRCPSGCRPRGRAGRGGCGSTAATGSIDPDAAPLAAGDGVTVTGRSLRLYSV